MACTGRWIIVLLLAGLLAGCGGTDFRAQPVPDSVPDNWRGIVNEANKDPWTVLGFGRSAEEGGSPLSGRSGADSRARDDLASRMAERLDHLQSRLGEAMASEEQGEGLESSDVEAMLKRAGDIAMNQSHIPRRHRNESGTWQALAVADLEKGLREVASRRDLSQGVQEKLMKEARKALGSRKGGQEGSESGEAG
ncbi:hypothetical protein AN478_06535 [Thiohalorhabdus denitrificans]|uniref:LPP20 lipoprotein n=1 Tax=Thiohalorhabdus denitrificans TaxID=381306 RepID=A0A0N8PN38_9GAMM|nr:hypothetical protein [Thiohalorhabdus denitrificans]KPV40445.1 hypothetical protein AN478_06535 [Thiohalorhabdus denitrificans]SCY61005.1 hypothetical protein SAMN05661077_2670 [Thiohalorhabdus denitrificans]